MKKYVAIKKKEREFLISCSQLEGLNPNEINLLNKDIEYLDKQISIEQNLLEAIETVESWFKK